MLELTSQNAIVRQYFDPFTKFDLSGPKLDCREGIDRLREVLSKNINDYNDGPDHTAIALTGGFDSRSVVALLGEDLINYQFYSYGIKGSWDLDIPKEIAKKLSLQYSSILLDESYEKEFSRYAK